MMNRTRRLIFLPNHLRWKVGASTWHNNSLYSKFSFVFNFGIFEIWGRKAVDKGFDSEHTDYLLK